MTTFGKPSRSGNICHRLELPKRPRRRLSGRSAPAVALAQPAAPRRAMPVELTVQKPQGDGSDPQVELLERRLDKVNALLATREGELERLGKSSQTDSGLASIYRDVQGLDQGEQDLIRKRQLMARIFEANLDLKRGLNSGTPAGR